MLLAVHGILPRPVCGAFAQSSTRQPLNVTGYTIDAQLDPVAQRLTATAAVTFTAVQDLTSATFELNNGLRITKITGPDGKPLDSDRDARRSTVTVSLPTTMASGTSATFTFAYSGILKEADTSPVEGIKMAALAQPVSMLLYPGRWFPMVGLYTDRFTMNLRATVPGRRDGGWQWLHRQEERRGQQDRVRFQLDEAGLSGHADRGQVSAGDQACGQQPGLGLYVTEKHKANAAEYGAVAAQQQEFFTTSFGQPETSKLQIVEIPDDAVAASWAPEIAAIAGNRIGDKNSYRLLANTVARQWWGSEISPYHSERRVDYERHGPLCGVDEPGRDQRPAIVPECHPRH